MTDAATLEHDVVATGQRPAAIRIAEADNVAVALRPISAGERISVGGHVVIARQDVTPGHKIALADVTVDEQIVKYGVPIGLASATIAAGDWVQFVPIERAAFEATNVN